MRKLNNQEIKSIQLKMLDEIYTFCDKKGLKIYLSGGTLIGAILYKGFIPWDDDIDLNMPRTDYDKLMELKQDKDFPEHLRLYDCEHDIDYVYPFAKLVDQNTYLIEDANTDNREFGIWIDIFPFDGAPNDINVQHRLIDKTKNVFKWLLFSTYRIGTGTTLLKTILKIIPLLILKIYGTNRLACNLNKIARKIGIGCTDYVGLIVAPTNYGEIFPYEGYLDPTSIEFENKRYKVPSNYKTYIKNRYGKITLDIPDDKKANHNYEAYLI